jgi:tetratricopeptide (TPR) repeat protein
MNRPALAAVLLGALILPARGYDTPEIRDAMREVFGNMRVLLELSASTQDLARPENEERVLAATRALADQAAIVSEHAPRDEVSFLAASLDRYASWLRRSYEWGRYETTQRLLHDAVAVCIACHTRLPSRRDSPLARDFLADERMASLPARDRAELAIATRRFEEAMTILESLLAGEPQRVDFHELVRRYLLVALRVKGHPGRAERTLSALARHPELSPSRREQLHAWSGMLQRLTLDPPLTGDLAAARSLVQEGESRRNAGRPDALVLYVAASRVLYEHLESESASAVEGAEAYYLLGLAHYRIEEGAWLPQAELFLEKAIRTAPSSEHARRALALLRAKLLQSFPAAEGGMPLEVRQHLDMLRELVTPRPE